MRKWLDSKAGATYLAEIPNTTLCVKKDGIELIYKMDRGLYIVINVMRAHATELMLLAEWGGLLRSVEESRCPAASDSENLSYLV